jgi:hypothetical protein
MVGAGWGLRDSRKGREAAGQKQQCGYSAEQSPTGSDGHAYSIGQNKIRYPVQETLRFYFFKLVEADIAPML